MHKSQTFWLFLLQYLFLICFTEKIQDFMFKPLLMNDKLTNHYIIQKCDTFFLSSVPTWKLMIDSLHIPQYLYRIFHAIVAQSIDLTMTHNNIMMVHSCLFEVMLTPVSWSYVTTMKQTDCHVVYLLRLMDTIRRVHSEQNHLLNNLNDYIHWLF